MATDLRQLISPEKFLPFYRDRAARTGEALPPIAVELHWTSDCNYDCVHCSYGSRRQSKGRLTAAQIDGVVEDLIGLKAEAAYISGGGEPTVLKGWQDWAQRLIDGGVEVALVTNGVVLAPAHAEILGRMNYIAVSVYSTDEDEYRRITESRFFDRQWTVPALVRQAGGKAVVGARCVLNNINHRNLLPIYRRAREAGFDYIIFIPAVDYEGRGISLGTDAIGEVLDDIAAHSGEFDPAFTNALDLLARNVAHYAPQDYRALFTAPPTGCAAIDIGANAFVNYCGGVWLCQPHIGDPRYCIGNLNEQRFAEMWNSPRHQRVVASLDRNFSAGTCRNCRSIAFNQAADRYVTGSLSVGERHYDPFL